jgi:hypothetical protein
MKTHPLLVYFFIFFIFSIYPQSLYASDSCLHDGIKMVLYEKIEQDNGRQIYLKCVTKKMFFGTDHAIEFAYEIAGAKIDVKFNRVRKLHGISGSSLTQAIGLVNLSNVPINTYKLRFDVFGAFNSGTLRVNEDSYVFSEMEGNCLELDADTVGRIPQYTIWGELYYSTKSTNHLAADFVQTMKNADAIQRSLLPGKYADIEVGATLNQLPENQEGSSSTLYEFVFAFKYKGKDKKIREFLETFEEKYRDLFTAGKVGLEVFGDTGFHYESK